MSLSEMPIGIFDSGLGGLTAVKAIETEMMNENIVFLGDTLNVPYGDKTKEQITGFAYNNAAFLISKNVKAIVIACNTVDSTAKHKLLEKYSLPIVGVVEPAAQKASKVTKNKKIGVIATAATVKSEAYEKRIKECAPDCEVFCVPAPLLVPLVEQGKINKDDKETEDALIEYLTPLKEKGVDTLVLGCTHYPLCYDLVKEIMPDVNIVCSGESSLFTLKEILKKNGLLNKSGKKGDIEYFVTGEPSYFEKHAGIFLGRSIEGKVKKV